ncbi:MAG: DUF1295 domain-containing protein [bacterium]|nr:DUF1295 domain-containing protein [bacterium]
MMPSIVYLEIAIVVVYFTWIWFLSVFKKDVSIVDIAWGIGFLLLALLHFLLQPPTLRGTVVLLLTSIWAVRLSGHIYLRHRGKPEDARYRKWREEGGSSWWWQSYFRVFLLQAAILWIVARPLAVSISAASTAWQLWDSLAVLLWAIGFGFELIGDCQLVRFLKQPDRPPFLRTGLWRYTRHPNYFGEAVLWWGFGLFAVSVGEVWALVSPILITVLLRFFSGVPLLETSMMKKEGYADYCKTTNAFFPWFPKHRSI